MRTSTIAFLVCVGFFVAFNNSQLCSFHGTYSDTAFDSKATNYHVKNSHNKPVGPLRLQRLARYKARYNYKPPSSQMNLTEKTKLCGTGPDFQPYFRRNHKERSGDNEDQDLYKMFFKNDTDELGNLIQGSGIIEMGAFDGIQQSNSRFFEECLGWEALLVEGMPMTYEKLIVQRPQAHRMNFAPSCTEEEDANNKTVAFDNYPMTNAGLGNVKTSYSVKNWTVDVPCGSMTPVLLDIFPHGHVTLFSLDVEGSEPLIVKNIDFDRVFIEIMIIEHNNNFCAANGKCQSRDEFRKIMDENGYIRFTRGVQKSDLYIHPLSRFLEKALSVKYLKEEYERFLLNREGKNEIPPMAIWG